MDLFRLATGTIALADEVSARKGYRYAMSPGGAWSVPQRCPSKPDGRRKRSLCKVGSAPSMRFSGLFAVSETARPRSTG